MLRVFAKKHAFQNLMYLASNTTRSKVHVFENTTVLQKVVISVLFISCLFKMIKEFWEFAVFCSIHF